MKVDYTVRYAIINNSKLENLLTILDYEVEFDKNVKDVIVKDLKEKISENIALIDITPTFRFIEINEIKDKEDIYNKSKEIWKEFENTDEFKIIQVESSYSQILQLIEAIRISAKELNLLNTQEFINFMDNLNKLSIDPEQ